MFRVGQDVVCVKPSGVLKLNGIYTVSPRCPVCANIGFSTSKFLSVNVVGEAHSCGTKCSEWAIDRFRPIVSRKTSIEIFQRMLTPKQKELAR